MAFGIGMAPPLPALACDERLPVPGAFRSPALAQKCTPGAEALDIIAVPVPKQQQPNGTPGKKPPAPSLKLRLGRTPLEQRSGSEPPEPLAQRRSTVGKEDR
jgi:hypothetical protein